MLLVTLGSLLSLAAGYRWFGPGRDYSYYVDFYSELAPRGVFSASRFEPGFVAVAWLFKYGLRVGPEPFISSLAALSLAVKFSILYKRTLWPVTACLTYIALFYVLHEYTQIRAAVAIAFGLASIEAYLDRQWARSVVLIAIAATFHSSILLLGLGVTLFNAVRLGPVAVLFVLLIVTQLVQTALSPAGIDVLLTFNPWVAIYAEESLALPPLNPFSAINLSISTLVIVSILVVSRNDRSRVMYLIMTMLAIAIFFALIDLEVLAQRIRDIFAIFGLMLAFSFQRRSFVAIPAALMVTAGFWSLYNVTAILSPE